MNAHKTEVSATNDGSDALVALRLLQLHADWPRGLINSVALSAGQRATSHGVSSALLYFGAGVIIVRLSR
jgi:hypothetical protein